MKIDHRFTVVRTRVQGQRPFDLDDPAFRSRMISLASTGMPRRGVAASVGKNVRLLDEWLDRGQADPTREPYASFSVDYLRAERGIERCGASAIARKVQSIHERQELHDVAATERGPEPIPPEPLGPEADPEECEKYEKRYERWERRHATWSTLPPEPTVQEYEWLTRTLASRFPKDHGIHALRELEPDANGAAYNERAGLTSDQLRAILRDPPEEIRAALIAEADNVFGLLIQSGWAPATLVDSTKPKP